MYEYEEFLKFLRDLPFIPIESKIDKKKLFLRVPLTKLQSL